MWIYIKESEAVNLEFCEAIRIYEDDDQCYLIAYSGNSDDEYVLCAGTKEECAKRLDEIMKAFMAGDEFFVIHEKVEWYGDCEW